MEWIKQLNKVLEYIEENLDGEISYERAAQIACCSTYHFQRMFSYIAGIPVSEYIRRRRMTAAAFDLQSDNYKISEIALKYGYNSPTSFNRAFQSIHDTAPSSVRKKEKFLTTYPRLHLRISVTGNEEMKYRIEEKKAFRIIGIKVPLETDIDKNFKTVPEFWQKFRNSDMLEKTSALMNQEPYGMLGITAFNGPNDLYYYIGAASDKPVPADMYEYDIPAKTWAVFQCTGAVPEAFQKLYHRFYSEWLPVSDYIYSNGPDIEVYNEGDPSHSDYQCELWMAVTPKRRNKNEF